MYTVIHQDSSISNLGRLKIREKIMHCNDYSYSIFRFTVPSKMHCYMLFDWSTCIIQCDTKSVVPAMLSNRMAIGLELL